MEFVPVEIKFYIGYGPWSTNVDRLILIRSKPYVHVELKFSDGWSFSSSARKDLGAGKCEGVRFKLIDYSHLERWHTIILWVTKEEEARMRVMAELLHSLGLKYDFRAIVGFLVTGRHNHRAYFCSEVVYAILAICFLPPDMNYKMHPTDLERICNKLSKILEKRRSFPGTMKEWRISA